MPAALLLALLAAAPADPPLRPAAPATVAAGTVVGEGPPKGWSHLVQKSLPAVRADQRDKVRDLTVRMASWMFTLIVADAVKDAGGYRVRAVGLGLGTNLEGRDTVATPDTPGLGWIGPKILQKAYDRQADSRVVGTTRSLAVLDTPVWFALGGRHTLVRYRYALRVDPATGDLTSWVWRIDPGERLDPAGAAVRLPANAVERPQLLIDDNEFTLGVPSEAAFAVDKLPAGDALTLPAAARPLAAASRYTAGTLDQLERALVSLPR